ncbi:MAG: nucleoside triphosphate pyrophosphohydrolase [Rikenellaceae bacterium]
MQDIERSRDAIERILRVMSELREQCPWDREQSFATLRPMTIEEVYELADAIDRGDMAEIREELGDVLLHIVFYCRMAAEQGAFEFADVVDGLCQKLIYRHPHIYGDVEADTPEEVKRNWEELKLKKKGRKSGLLGGVPRGLPAMMKTERILAKVGATGFSSSNVDIWERVESELARAKSEGEFGELFFALIEAARSCKVDAEAALESANRGFTERFAAMELLAESEGKSVAELSLEEMEQMWQRGQK